MYRPLGRSSSRSPYFQSSTLGTKSRRRNEGTQLSSTTAEITNFVRIQFEAPELNVPKIWTHSITRRLVFPSPFLYDIIVLTSVLVLETSFLMCLTVEARGKHQRDKLVEEFGRALRIITSAPSLMGGFCAVSVDRKFALRYDV